MELPAQPGQSKLPLELEWSSIRTFKHLLGCTHWSDRASGIYRAARNTRTKPLTASASGPVAGWLSLASCDAIHGERRDSISCRLPCPTSPVGTCRGDTGAGVARTKPHRSSCAARFGCYIDFHAYLHS